MAYWEELHRALDRLMAHHAEETRKFPSRTTVMELAEWSNKKRQGETGKPPVAPPGRKA